MHPDLKDCILFLNTDDTRTFSVPPDCVVNGHIDRDSDKEETQTGKCAPADGERITSEMIKKSPVENGDR